MRRILQIISIVSICVISSASFAQIDLGSAIQPEKGKPINIKSESLVIRNNENLSIFKKNVRVTQGKMILTADEVRLYTDYDEKTKKSKFKTIEAEGNVDFNSMDKSVQSRLAAYDVKSGTLVLTDNVKLKGSEGYLEGKIFVYNVNTGRSEIRNSTAKAATSSGSSGASSGGRVHAVFAPSEEIKNFALPTNALDGLKGKKVPSTALPETLPAKTPQPEMKQTKEPESKNLHIKERQPKKKPETKKPEAKNPPSTKQPLSMQ